MPAAALNNNYRPIIDMLGWRYDAVGQVAMSAGSSVAWDHRNNNNGSPYVYVLYSAAAFHAYDPASFESVPLASPGLAGTFGAGATAITHPSQGPRGTINATGATPSSFALTTALPAAVGVNQLANRGDGVGFVVRVIGKGAGSSGKTEERRVVANTGGTTPTIWLDAPLSWTPLAGDAYEFRSGRVFLLSSGLLAANAFKYYDTLTNSYAALSITNLPATITTDSNAVALSEAHVPYNRAPGEGFVSGAGTTSDGKNCIVATASSSTTLTGAGMPAGLTANEYRNFQVRIVEDTATPTAVNQRLRITSHTGGENGVFTFAAAGVTPSATAKFVIENDDDKILMRSTATTVVYNYNCTANTWDTTTWAAAPAAHGAGVIFEQSFGLDVDVGRNARHSHMFCLRGGASAAIDVLDIAGAATGSWSADIVYGKKGQTFTTGTSGAYDPVTNQGRLMHINVNGGQRMARFDMKNRIIDANPFIDTTIGTATVGQRMCNVVYVDTVNPAVKLNRVTMFGGSSSSIYSVEALV